MVAKLGECVFVRDSYNVLTFLLKLKKFFQRLLHYIGDTELLDEAHLGFLRFKESII